MRRTWQLWSALRRRPRHPLYRRGARLPPLSITPLMVALALGIGAAALALPAFFSTLMLALVAGVYLLGIYQGTIAGLLWALRIVEEGWRARADGRFALYAAAPAGALGASWSLVAACLHQDDALEKRRGLNAESYVVAILLAIFLGARPIPDYAPAEFAPLGILQTQILLSACAFAALLALFYCNHVSAIVFGVLLGMLLPTVIGASARLREEARFGVALAFAALHIGTTVAALLGALLLWPLCRELPLGRTAGFCVYALACVMLFYALREMAIDRLFATVLRRHGGDFREWRCWLMANSEAPR